MRWTIDEVRNEEGLEVVQEGMEVKVSPLTL